MKGSTPLDIDELQDIKINVSTRKELDDAEYINIAAGIDWAERNPLPIQQMLTVNYLCELHLRMFGNVWKWAGKLRKSDKNIGVSWPYIYEHLKNALDDAKAWVDFKTFSCEEIAARLHHRLVVIHPFVNGNGRITRIFASLAGERLGCNPLEWGGLSISSIQQTQEVREKYLKALRSADEGDFEPLVKFCSSPEQKDNGGAQCRMRM